MYYTEVYLAGIQLLSIIILFGLSTFCFVLSFIFPSKIKKDLTGDTTYQEPSMYLILFFLLCVANVINTIGFFTSTLLKALVKLGYLA